MARRGRGALGKWADRQIARDKQVQRENRKRRRDREVARLDQTAEMQTTAVRVREDELQQLLVHRSRDLCSQQGTVAQTFESDGAVALAEIVEQILTDADRPRRFPRGCEVGYEAEARALRVRYELPTLEDAVPKSVGSRYIKAANEVRPIARRPAERKAIYRQVVTRTTLRALADAFDVTPVELVESAVVNGYVTATDPSTGRADQFTVVSVTTTRTSLAEVNLTDPALNPTKCLQRFGARISPHPEDLVPVRPVVPWVDLSRYKALDPSRLAESADDRIDLLTVHFREFELLIRDLFAAMGFQAWRTNDSHDEGIDVYATVEDEITGMDCVIQAKRYSRRVEPQYVHALHGALTDKNAHKGFLVTTAWFGPSSEAYAARNRIELIAGRRLKELLHGHLGMDVVIPLGKLPPGWDPLDIT